MVKLVGVGVPVSVVFDCHLPLLPGKVGVQDQTGREPDRALDGWGGEAGEYEADSEHRLGW